MKIGDFFKKLMPNDENEDYDEYDDYSDFDDEETDEAAKKGGKKNSYADDFDEDEDDDLYGNSGKKAESTRPGTTYTSQKVVGTTRTGNSTGMGNEVCMIIPKSYEDVNTIADVLLKNKAVVLNLEGIDMSAAQRIIDFASGACYTLGGSLQKISKKIFMIVPESMNLGGDFDPMLGDMIDLNSVNMMK